MAAKKTLYHSELVKRGEVLLTIKSEPMASKFKGPDYVIVFDHDESMERQYSTENDEIAECLKKWKGQTVTLTASGRDDDAEIFVEEASQSEMPRNTRTATQGKAKQTQERATRKEEAPAKTPMTKEEKQAAELETLRRAFAYGKKFSRLKIMLMPLIVEEAHAAEELGYKYATEDFRASLHTLVIEVKSHTHIDALPMKMPDMKPDKAPQKPVADPHKEEAREARAKAFEGKTRELTDDTEVQRRQEALKARKIATRPKPTPEQPEEPDELDMTPTEPEDGAPLGEDEEPGW